MTEFSGLWTTTGTPSGDQQSSYTQSQLTDAFQVICSVGDSEGISPNYLNGYEATDGGVNTVDVNTGAALVDGKYHISDAVENVNIPSASGGGNTRIDRIVLRADWSAFTVRIHRIAGTDAASPTAPSVTQNPGVTYDIKICQVLVDTSGNVTVTNEHEFATIAFDSVFMQLTSTGVLELINDPVSITSREGGHSGNWATPGSTSQTLVPTQTQVGAAEHSGISLSAGAVSVDFPIAFSGTPLVIAIHKDNGGLVGGDIVCYIDNVTASDFDLGWQSHSGSAYTDLDFMWIAIGPIS